MSEKLKSEDNMLTEEKLGSEEQIKYNRNRNIEKNLGSVKNLKLIEKTNDEKKLISIDSMIKFINKNLLVWGIAVLAIIASVISPTFLTVENLLNILRQAGSLSFVALGMTFVIIGGYVDLSVAGTFSLVGVITASLIAPLGQVPALAVGMLVGTLCGLFIAVVLIIVGARSDADSLFITFGMSNFLTAIALIYTKGSIIRMPDNSDLYRFLGSGKIMGVPAAFIIFFVLMIIAHVILNKTTIGREIRLTGGNRTAAELAGISSAKATIIVFALIGLLTAVGGIVQFSRVTFASPIMGKNFELQAILAVVIGGTRFKSGVGSVLGTGLGILLVTVMANALNLIGVPINMQEVFRGAILVVAIWLDYRKKH